MRTLLQSSVDIISLASIYSIIAIGLALVFGVMRFINFAHGELIMITGYALYLVGGSRSFPVMALGGLAVAVAAALLMERVAFRPIRGSSMSTQLVTSFALAFLIQSLVTVAFGARAKSVGMPTFMTDQTIIAGFRVSNLDLISVGTAVALLAALTIFLRRTALGIQMRAAAEDFEMARLLGVRANTVIAFAFAISGLLAAAAGILLVAKSGTLVPTMGLQPVVIGFVAIIVGGLGSLAGAALGSLVLSALTVTLQALLPYGVRQFRDAFVFAAVIGIFFFRPRGLIVDRRLRTRV
jgi:branched-chain amino acid transport system permease protein